MMKRNRFDQQLAAQDEDAEWERRQAARFCLLYLKLRDLGLDGLSRNGEAAIEFDDNGHKYRITEVED